MSKEILAYLSGIIDSEGNVVTTKYVHLRVSNKSELLIRFLQKNWNGSVSLDKRPQKSCYSWKASNKKFIPLLPQLKNYLLIKRRQIELWIKVISLYRRFNHKEYGQNKEIVRNIRKRISFLNQNTLDVLGKNLSNSEELPKWDNSELSLSEKLSYLAGLIDGDGYIYMKKVKNKEGNIYYYPTVGIVSIHKWFIDYLIKEFPATLGIKKPKLENRRYLYEWLSHQETIKFLIENNIENFSLIKKKQWKLVKKFYTFGNSEWGKAKEKQIKVKKIVAYMRILNNSLKGKCNDYTEDPKGMT